MPSPCGRLLAIHSPDGVSQLGDPGLPSTSGGRAVTLSRTCRLAVACTLSAILALTGCSTPVESSPSPSSTHVGGVEVTVPALWADPAKGVGGIEPAVVWAGTIGPPGFGVDLQTIEAQGAGASWQAASASAAAVGTMYSGLDPASVDIDFQITGPIDGPSAGGILTVGVLAALRDTPLKPGVTMTGTISPDGSVGPVGGVDIKLKAARDAGYDTVLLPPANIQVLTSTTGEAVSAEQLGKELGITIVSVPTLAQAYEAFTGTSFAPEVPVPYWLPPSVTSAAHATAQAMVARLDEAIAQAPADLPDRATYEQQAADVRVALAAGDDATAYGMGADGYLGVVRASAEAKMLATIRKEGLRAANAQIRADAQTGIDDATTTIRSGAVTTGLGLEQQLCLPSALAWPTEASARLTVLLTDLPAAADESTLTLAARIIAEQRASIDAFLPDALAVVRAMPSKTALPEESTIEFLSQYTNFLVRAGDANLAYLDVTSGGRSPSAAGSDLPSVVPVVAELSNLTKQIPLDEQPLAQEIEQSSAAMTYFVVSTSSIAATQAFGLNDFELDGADTADYPGALTAAVGTGLATVNGFASQLGQRGLDAGYPVWSATWGSAAERALTARERATAGGVLALNEIWYDSISVLMINAAPSPQEV